jgi:hypothetical protein
VMDGPGSPKTTERFGEYNKPRKIAIGHENHFKAEERHPHNVISNNVTGRDLPLVRVECTFGAYIANDL